MSIFSKAQNEPVVLENNYDSIDIINGDIVRVTFRYGNILSNDIVNERLEPIGIYKYDDENNLFKRAREEYLYERSWFHVDNVVGTNPESGIHMLYEARYPSMTGAPYYINPYIGKMRFYINFVKKKRNYKK